MDGGGGALRRFVPLEPVGNGEDSALVGADADVEVQPVCDSSVVRLTHAPACPFPRLGVHGATVSMAGVPPSPVSVDDADQMGINAALLAPLLRVRGKVDVTRRIHYTNPSRRDWASCQRA